MRSIVLNMLCKKHIQCNDMTRNMTRYVTKKRIGFSLSFLIITISAFF
nr:MAG TPA: hypothetical protein [Caudoviricetes sp.]